MRPQGWKLPVINLGGPNSRLILYQGSTLNPDQLSSGYMGFDTNLSPAMAAAHNRTVIVAVDASGAIFYNWWDFGGGDHGWISLGTDVKTSARPAVSLVDNGNYMFILATGERHSLPQPGHCRWSHCWMATVMEPESTA